MYTVERGAYSDHRVLCVCKTKRQANAIVKAYNGDPESWGENAFVGELPIVTKAEKITTFGLICEVWDDGRVTDEREDMRTEFTFDMLWSTYAAPVIWRWVRAPTHQGKGGRLEVHGTDLERVRRVYSDRRAQLLAEDAFRMKREAKG